MYTTLFACLLGAGVVGATNTILASDPRILYQGRTLINTDGSRTFDWEAVQMQINIANASYINALFSSTGPITRIKAYINDVVASEFYVTPQSNSYTVSVAMPGSLQSVLLFNTFEPNVEEGSSGPGITFYGFQTDGTALSASPPLQRSIEFVGDSITVGFGSTGQAPCLAGSVTTDNSLTYDAYICRNFSANCTVIAWSGKGMYENCCDTGLTMPAYYLRTLGGSTSLWDFSRFTPQAMIINLGTNDFNHDSGAAWEAAFVSTYLEFMTNVTTIHYRSQPPVFFIAQGPMNNSQQLYDCLQTIITKATAAGMSAHFLDMRSLTTDGCGGHPGVIGHQQMFEKAQPQIAAVMGWS